MLVCYLDKQQVRLYHIKTNPRTRTRTRITPLNRMESIGGLLVVDLEAVGVVEIAGIIFLGAEWSSASVRSLGTVAPVWAKPYCAITLKSNGL